MQNFRNNNLGLWPHSAMDRFFRASPSLLAVLLTALLALPQCADTKGFLTDKDIEDIENCPECDLSDLPGR